jgi:hypothetical protein
MLFGGKSHEAGGSIMLLTRAPEDIEIMLDDEKTEVVISAAVDEDDYCPEEGVSVSFARWLSSEIGIRGLNAQGLRSLANTLRTRGGTFAEGHVLVSQNDDGPGAHLQIGTGGTSGVGIGCLVDVFLTEDDLTRLTAALGQFAALVEPFEALVEVTWALDAVAIT